jgi:hypothetical protein
LEEELEAAEGDSLRGMEEAVGADAVETAGRDMLQEAPQELVRREGHRLAEAGAGVAIGEGHAAVVGGDEALVGERGTVDVAAEVLEEGIGAQVAGGFGIDDPWLAPGDVEEVEVGMPLEGAGPGVQDGEGGERFEGGVEKGIEEEALV